MKTARRNSLLSFLVTVVLIGVVIISVVMLFHRKPEPEPVDPHAGQVYIYDGFDWIWMTPLEGVPVNELTEDKFEYVGGQPAYIGQEYDVLQGVDVSEHQEYIDWEQAAHAGIDFAYIRIGWRGYTEGNIFQDEYFSYNMQSAADNGIMTGVYFFSQAISVQEAIEEARFVIDRISGYNISLPVVFDWEKITDDDARTDELDMAVRTDCAVAFCEIIKSAGYTPCVYFNRDLGYYGYDLRRLTNYKFWFSLPESGFPNFYYASDIWQYSFTDIVPGIDGETDMNMMFIPKPQPESS